MIQSFIDIFRVKSFIGIKSRKNCDMIFVGIYFHTLLN